MKNRHLIHAVALTLILVPALASGADSAPVQVDEITQRLASGWNTWNTRSVLAHVLLPEGFGLSLGFKQVRWLDEPYLREALIGRSDPDAPRIRPGLHASDGRYTELTIVWQDLAATVESAHVGDDLVILVEPLAPPEQTVKLVVETAMYWNRSGTLEKLGADHMRATVGGQVIEIFATAGNQEDYYVQTVTPYLVLPVDGPLGLSTGSRRSLDEIRAAVAAQRADLEAEAAAHDELAEAYLAVQSGVAWNMVYEPTHDRVVSTVGRLWNEEYGGYCLFGWDNFFLAYVTSLWSRDLAFANVIEHLDGATDDGFIANDNRGNGSKSFDRSQPPVGGLMVREIYKRYPERWFLEAVFEPLLRWNRWWIAHRMNDGLLSYGSSPAKNPFNEPSTQTRRTAGYESGMDDSPMYEGVPFDRETFTFALQDVGLTSLVIADAEALAEMAGEIGREDAVVELRKRAGMLREGLDRLWHEETGLYLNRRSDTGELSNRLSPTLFYPMLSRVPSQARAQRMVHEHLLNPEEFWGEWVLPSIARSDPAFPQQRYWKGAIWPPLNFLTYLALRSAGYAETGSVLAQKSLAMFLSEWRRQGFVSENYSSITGTGDDKRLSSDRFHSWGTLFGIMAFVESGALPAPENTLRNEPPERAGGPWTPARLPELEMN